ncbi:MAG TPA: GAF domain-containing protein, partial [Kofleriaceae bacterium]|nr:GAF domain-containing protein [Kofleriaceae bacterium]
LDTDRAYCLFVDAATGALWSEARRRAGGDDRRAIAGIAGWAAHTGQAVSVPRASADPRWLGPIDDPDGDPHGQLLVQPLVHGDRRVLGVLIAARRPRRPGFTETDAALLARFAALVAPAVEHIAIATETRTMLGEDPAARAEPTAPTARAQGPLATGHPWSRWIFLAIGVLAGLLLGLLV